MERDFNEFMRSRLTESRIEEMAKEINQSLDSSNPISLDQIGTAIGVISASFAIKILAEYHEWLFEDCHPEK